VTFLRYWLAVSGVVIGFLAAWAFAPVLLFVLALVLGLGILSAGVVYFAHWLRALRERG
jgi:hypothetical protein